MRRSARDTDRPMKMGDAFPMNWVSDQPSRLDKPAVVPHHAVLSSNLYPVVAVLKSDHRRFVHFLLAVGQFPARPERSAAESGRRIGSCALDFALRA
jgi:hypothetical protein